MKSEPHPQPVHKVIISGTGRAGTTFLVQVMNAVGLDTGIDRGLGKKYDTANAGYEIHWDHPDAPYILKSPSFCETLRPLLAEGRFIIDHAIVPIRDLEEAAASRVHISVKTKRSFWRWLLRRPHRAAGGMWGTTDPDQQASVLAVNFHRLLHTLAVYDIPVTFLEFPRLVNDSLYLYTKLKPILGNITFAKFDTAFHDIAQPELVHSFKERLKCA